MFDPFEVLLALLGVALFLAALAWLVVGPILLSGLQRRVRRLEEQLRALSRRPAPRAEAEAEAAPREVAPPVAAPAKAAPPAVAPARPAERPPIPAEVVAAEPVAPPPAEVSPFAPSRAAGGAVPAPPPPTAAPPAPPETGRPSFEELMAGKWLTWLGALAVVIGAGFFFKYAVDREWIGERGRVAIGVVVGMAVFAGGALAMLRNYRYLSQGLVGAALGILYFSLYAAFAWYAVLPQGVAFGGMICVTAAALGFSTYFNAQPTAILGLLGGLLTPVMLSTGVDAQITLFSYVFVLDLGVLGIATFRKWQPLQALAFLGTLAIWLAWFGVHYAPEKLGRTLVLLTAYFLLFALLGLWHNVLRRKPPQPGDFFLILATPVAYFIGLYAVTEERYDYLHGLLAVTLAAAYLGQGVFALVRNPQGRGVVISLAGLAAAFLTLAIPLQLTGHWIAIAWAAEALLLVELGLRLGEIRLRWAGFGLLAVVQLILLYYAAGTLADPEDFQTRFTRPEVEKITEDMPESARAAAQPTEPAWTDVFNGRSFSFLASAVVLGALAWEYRRRAVEAERDRAVGAAVEPQLFPLDQIAGVLLAAVPLTLLLLLLLETYTATHTRDWLFATLVGVSAVWTAAAAVSLVALSVYRGPRWLHGVGLGLFGLLGLMLVVGALATFAGWRSEWRELEAQLEGTSIWYLPLLNPRSWGYLAAIAAAAGAALLYGLTPAAEPAARGQRRGDALTLAQLLLAYGYLTALALVTVEVYAHGVVRGWETATGLAVTLAWTLFATVSLVVGIFYRSATLRIMALAVFGITAVKVFLFDVWKLETTIRVFAFIGLGVALLTASFLYRRFRARIHAWIVPPLLLLAALPSWVQGQDAQSAPTPDTAQQLLITLRQRWPIEKPDAASGEFVRLTLPPEIYGVASSSLADLRILAGEEADVAQVPYVLLQPRDHTESVTRRAPLLDLSQRAGRTEFLLDLGAAFEPVNHLEIEISDEDRNYERPLTVYAADRRDAAEWNLLTDDGYLLDVTRGSNRLHVDTVRFPQSRFRFYKVEIDNGGEPPLDVRGATLSDRVHVQVEHRSYTAGIVSQETSNEDQQTRVVLDLKHPGLPTVGLRLDVAHDKDFFRPVALEASDELGDDARWRHVASGHLYRFARGNRRADQTSVGYAETRTRYLRVTIANGDDRPLTVEGAVAEEIPRYLVARRDALTGDGPVALYAGNARLRAPRYDLARTIGDVSPADLPEAALRPQEANPFYQGPVPPLAPWSERNEGLLWTLTIAGVVVLGLLTVLLLRKAAAASRGAGD